MSDEFAKITWPQFFGDVRGLAGRFHVKPDAIYPASPDGVAPALILASELAVPMASKLTKDTLLIDAVAGGALAARREHELRAAVYYHPQGAGDLFAGVVTGRAIRAAIILPWQSAEE